MKENKKGKQGEGFMMKAASFIVDKRNLFFLLFAIAVIFSAFSRNWVGVENDLAAYLPDMSETRRSLDVMESEFTTFGTADIMVANVSYAQAEKLAEETEKTEGVFSVEFDNTMSHYNEASALLSISFDYPEEDERCLEVLEQIKDSLSEYDIYVSCQLGDTTSETIASEMQVIIVIVAIVVLTVLLLTSDTYAEVPVLIITFLASAIVNMGTNFLLGTISFVSNSVTIVLQLALSVDYAVIFCNRYKEEHQSLPPREACITALSKSIPEIFASSLTTIGGLAAMMFMQFKIGPDMGIVLIKAILLSLLSVFLLMPGLLVLFSGPMDKSAHKSFVPKIPFVGKFAYATRKLIPPVFVAVVIVAIHFSNLCPYVYGYSSLTTPKLNETQIAEKMISSTFSSKNLMALVVPAGDYERESALLAELETYDEVESTVGLSNSEALDGYMLTDKLTPRQFSELIDVDYEVAELLYAAYAVNDENYGKIVSGISGYSVPLIDMFLFLHQEVEEGYVSLDSELQETLDSAYERITNAKQQLQGSDYSRMLVYVSLPEDGQETFDFINTIHDVAGRYYGENVYVAGNSTSANDLRITFEHDNKVVSIVSILVVLVVLLFTFKSAGMPVLLIIVIQGSIWINFSIPKLMDSNLFFMGYLIVSSIQMGANIDYAIVISSRYQELKQLMPRKEAIIETMNLAFPTIITSGTMLAMAGVLIGQMTSEPCIAGIGQCLGRGTIISIILVMFVLPQILLLGDRIIDKTAFSVSLPIQSSNLTGYVRLDGVVRGEICGQITGVVHALVKGNVNVNVISGEAGEVRQLEEGQSDDKN